MIQRIALSGGAPIDVVEEPSINGASWAENGTIYYGGRGGIFAAAAAGGTPPELIVPIEASEGAYGPRLLPGGEWLMYSFLPANASWDDATIVAHSLMTGERRELMRGGSDAHYLSTGHLVYASEASLIAVPFDPETLQITGDPTSLLEGVASAGGVTGARHFALSDNGSLIYRPGAGGAGVLDQLALVWVDEAGNEELLGAPLGDYSRPSVSPDGRRVAVTVGTREGGQNIYIYDVASAGFERRTYSDGDLRAVWSPDGSTIAYASGTGLNDREILTTPSDGSGGETLLLTGEDALYPQSWASDGTMVVMRRTGGENEDLLLFHLDTEELEPLVATPFDEPQGSLSPDGRWLAYTSDDSGELQVFVRMVPGPSGRWPVSPGNGFAPAWSPDGKTIYYVSDGAMWAADMELGDTATAVRRRELFDFNQRFEGFGRPGGASLHLDPVSGRFLLVRRPAAAALPGAGDGEEPPARGRATPRINARRLARSA